MNIGNDNVESGKVKKERGCLFFGCLTVVIAGCLLTGFAVFSMFLVKKSVNGILDSSPVNFADESISVDSVTVVNQKIDQLDAAMNVGTEEIELEFTADELNTLIRTNKNLSELRDAVRLSIEGNRLRSRLSLPVDRLNLGFAKGKYINGEADLRISHSNGRLQVALETLTVKDQKIPEQLMSRIARINLAEKLYSDDQEIAKMLRQIRDIRVANGKFLITAGPGVAPDQALNGAE